MVVAKTRASARGRGILAGLARLGRGRGFLAPVLAAPRAAARLALLRDLALRRRRSRSPVLRYGRLGRGWFRPLLLLADRRFRLGHVDRRRLLAPPAAARAAPGLLLRRLPG